MLKTYTVYRYMTQTEKARWSKWKNIPLTQEYEGTVPLWRTSSTITELELTTQQKQELKEGATFFIQE